MVPGSNQQLSLTSEEILTNHNLYAINKVARKLVSIEAATVQFEIMTISVGVVGIHEYATT